jgi:tRNA (adenine-N(1)-)-methyltransferase non-catalytic subunit
LNEKFAVTREVGFIPDANNSQLVDNGKAQKLTSRSIETLRDQTDGENIVVELIKNSSSFDNKTEYSQEKYVTKKKMKYIVDVIPLPVTLRTSLRWSVDKDPRKHGGIRPEAVSMMLNHANVRANTISLVLDFAPGVLAASVARRHGGHGRILNACQLSNLHTWKAHSRVAHKFHPEALKQFNCTDLERSSVVSFPYQLFDAMELAQSLTQTTSSTSTTSMGTTTDSTPFEIPRDPNLILPPSSSSSNSMDYLVQLKHKEEAHALLSSYADVAIALRKQVDSALINCRYDPTASFNLIRPYLLSGAPIVFYSPSMQPLATLATKLRNDPKVAGVALEECWLREYQVLPNRTHPTVSGEPHSGFILRALIVDNTPARK